VPVSRVYKCPDCEGTFRFLHMTREEPPPEHCELCGNYMGEEPEEELAAPAIGGSALSKSVEAVYRTQERERGITDMRDALRPGDVAGREVRNSVTEFAAQAGMTYWQGGAPQEYISQSRQGPQAASTGASVLKAIQGGRK
jgi:hypothetical protein